MPKFHHDQNADADPNKLSGMNSAEFTDLVEGRLACPSFDEIDRYARNFVSGSDAKWASAFRRQFERHVHEDRCAICETMFGDLKVAASAAAEAADRAVA